MAANNFFKDGLTHFCPEACSTTELMDYPRHLALVYQALVLVRILATSII